MRLREGWAVAELELSSKGSGSGIVPSAVAILVGYKNYQSRSLPLLPEQLLSRTNPQKNEFHPVLLTKQTLHLP